jgi:hypothetical protein
MGVIKYLIFIFHATPLILNRLKWAIRRSIFSELSNYSLQKRIGMKTKLTSLICFFVLFAQTHVLAGNGPATINEKLVKAFKEAFPLAEKVDWNEIGNHYFVHFKENEVVSEIEYDHGGNFVSSERYYADANLLPIHVAWEIHKKFVGKSIYGVTESSTEAGTVYSIKLQDEKEWITVRAVEDGILGVVEKFAKS